MRIIILSLLLLVGCASTAEYENELTSWVGQSADHLISSWGSPTKTTQLLDGSGVLEYSALRNFQIGGFSIVIPQTTLQSGTTNAQENGKQSSDKTYNETGAANDQRMTLFQNISMGCVTRFTVNGQGIITNWAWQGNACKAKEPPQQPQPNIDSLNKLR